MFIYCCVVVYVTLIQNISEIYTINRMEELIQKLEDNRIRNHLYSCISAADIESVHSMIDRSTTRSVPKQNRSLLRDGADDEIEKSSIISASEFVLEALIMKTKNSKKADGSGKDKSGDISYKDIRQLQLVKFV